jgi:alanine-synthesizing transaminase
MEEEFYRIKRLPPYVFAEVDRLKLEHRRRGEDIIDLGMGNPDQATPRHIVDKLVEKVEDSRNHRYSASAGIPKLRDAICKWYKRRYDVEFDPDTEAVATIGAKEGISHLMLAISAPGDAVVVPTPTYPIHAYSVVIAGGDLRSIRLTADVPFLEQVEAAVRSSWPRPKAVLVCFPHNPTTQCVELDFFEKLVDFAREHQLLVIHDFAYADLVFDGYVAPSMMQVPGAREVGVEFFSLSKSYSMPGWRVGFCVGNPRVIHALKRIKSYLDYGMFQPIQIAAIIALNGPQECVEQVVEVYRSRRDTLIQGLARAGWPVEAPKATMFVWAPIPEAFAHMGSLEFSKFLLERGKVAVSPGIGFGDGGDGHVRFSLVENEHRIRQAIRGIKRALG